MSYHGRMIAATLLVSTLAVVVGCSTFGGDEGDSERLAALREVALPEDGLSLYQALLEEIPDVVAEGPCACCDNSLKWCYTGGCPPT